MISEAASFQVSKQAFIAFDLNKPDFLSHEIVCVRTFSYVRYTKSLF